MITMNDINPKRPQENYVKGRIVFGEKNLHEHHGL